jgi:hypothetical protein
MRTGPFIILKVADRRHRPLSTHREDWETTSANPAASHQTPPCANPAGVGLFRGCLNVCARDTFSVAVRATRSGAHVLRPREPFVNLP